MPIRVKSRLPAAGDRAPSPPWEQPNEEILLPDIGHDDSFRDVVKKVSTFVLGPGLAF